MSYNSRIIPIKIVIYFSQNYAGIQVRLKPKYVYRVGVGDWFLLQVMECMHVEWNTDSTTMYICSIVVATWLPCIQCY